MKHASAATLGRIEPLLATLRARSLLKEKSLGVFYLRGKAFLHFHDDPSGIFAGVRLEGADFTRFRIATTGERKALLKTIDQYLAMKV